MSQGLKYNVDIVMCIDCTGSMGALLDTVKANALRFHSDLVDACQKKGKEVSDLRVRPIGFRDFDADGEYAVQDGGFFTIPSQQTEFTNFIRSLHPAGGGDEPENGLEVLAMAINSDWTKTGDRRRHVIVVWSDASAHPIGIEKSKTSFYPQNMPTDFDELTDWWEDAQLGKMDPNAKRLLLFTPDANPWGDIACNWSNVIQFPARAGDGLNDVDYHTILDSVVNSI